ncbi:MAG: type II toxin-antitoxin system antitoxin SocA domain-containing protein [Hyphomicrobiales bacterium]
MTSELLDPRCVANLILDKADEKGFGLTHIQLQKILYFVHGLHLVRYNHPLVRGAFEAWTYGPVHTLIYDEFKSAGSAEIAHRATKEDLFTGERTPVPKIEDERILSLVDDILNTLGQMSAGQLVELSHAKSGPWGWVVGKSHTIYGKIGVGARNESFGLRISDKLIRERYRYHWVDLAEKDEPFHGVEQEPVL